MKGIHWFSLYNLCALVGALAVSLRGRIPDSISIMVGTNFVILAYFLLFLSVTALFGRRLRNLYFQVLLVLLGLAAMVQWGLVHPDTQHRLMAYSLVLFFQQAHIAVMLAVKKNGNLRTAGSAMGLTMVALSLFNLIRVAGVSLQGAPANYLNAGSFLAWIVILTSSLQGGAIVAYVWMTAALLRSDLQLQASTDPLTGLLNRRAIEISAGQLMGACLREGESACAIIIDLDNFKEINDEFGHSCGDAALIAVASCLQRGMRPRDLLARLGGDEFAVLLPYSSLMEATVIAEKLRSAIAETKVIYGAVQTNMTATLGLAEAKGIDLSWDHLMTSCDKALYRAKRMGGNLVGSAGARDESSIESPSFQ